MRVRCTQIISPVTGQSLSDSPWVSIGCVYVVISILAVPGRPVELQIIGDDDQTPGFWDSRMFITVEGRLPSNWVADVQEDGSLRVGPRTWLEPGYWEAFFDQDPGSRAIYDAELQQILSESPDLSL